MKNIHIYRIIQLLLLCFVFNVSFAQNGKNLGTKISDKTEVQPSNLKSNSILELESKAKGFLLPRMTTAERNGINVDVNNSVDTGLAIFNIDNDCVEYYTAISKKWVSLCGTLPPAKIEFNGICDQLQITKPNDFKFVAGTPITGQNVQVTVPVKINEVGTYQIDVYSRKEGKSNGYYFSTTGTFLSKGTIEVAIIGQGTPIDGYDDLNQGDTFVVNLNGTEVLVCDNKQYVKKAATKFTIIPKEYQVKGPLYLGVNTTNLNTVEIGVNVTGIGKYIIESLGDGVNGVSLYGEGEFTRLGDNIAVLRASGIPVSNLPSDNKGFEIPIKTNSGTQGSVPVGTHIYAKVEPTKLTPICVNIEKEGQFVKGSAIDVKGNVLRVPVKVLSPGKASLKMVSKDGFIFKSDEHNFTFDADKDNITEVVLRPESKVIPFTLDSTEFTFETNSALDLTGCKPFRIDFEQPAVDYEIENCNIILRSKNYPVAKPLPVEKFGIDIKVKVKIAGPYTIATKDLSNSGVSFTASGVFKVEEQGKVVQVTLVPSGEFGGDPNASTPYNYSIYKNIEQSEVCNFTINAGLRMFNILHYGSYSLPIHFNQVYSTENFGPKGKIATVLGINAFSRRTQAAGLSIQDEAIALKQYILNNEIDIVVFDIFYGDPFARNSSGSEIIDVFADLVKQKKITLLYFSGAYQRPDQHMSRLGSWINNVGQKFYPNDNLRPSWTYKANLYNSDNGVYEMGVTKKESTHRYLNPKYLSASNPNLGEAIRSISLKDKKIYAGYSRFFFNNVVSDNFIILSEKVDFKYSQTSGSGYVYYAMKDYPVIVMNGQTPSEGAFDKVTGFPRTDGRDKGVSYEGFLYMSIISEMIEQIKEGL
ncbi:MULTISPECIES: hypothetical protein [unclassified Myroides]|uniref:hypothetical protein n=1 Tax=unclassified Myroides TaxID=2642485 RepID=UPI00310123A5